MNSKQRLFQSSNKQNVNKKSSTKIGKLSSVKERGPQQKLKSNFIKDNQHCINININGNGMPNSKEIKNSKKELREIYDEKAYHQEKQEKMNYINRMKMKKQENNFNRNLEFLIEKKPTNDNEAVNTQNQNRKNEGDN